MISGKRKTVFILIWVCLILNFGYIFYYIRKPHFLDQTNEIDENLLHEEQVDVFMLNRASYIANNKDRIKNLKGFIKEINEEQNIGRVHSVKVSTFERVIKMLNKIKLFNNLKLDNNVLVIQVHGNYEFVEVFLHSLRKVLGIAGSLLIFSHDFYSPQIFKLINKVQFARVMQIFYPYSVQLHRYSYPGDDIRFCPEWNNCFYSNERADANQVQEKLFWWWTINEVFNRVEVLKNYSGYIYFMDVESYLTTDFIVVAKKLEQHLPAICPICQIVSLAAHPPRAEMYVRENSTVFIGTWGSSNYSNFGIGFNRSTWNQIKALKEEFCNFNDYRWEWSLRHLASTTSKKHLFMLSPGGPRILLTNDCAVFGSVRHCDLNSTYLDIANFTRTISNGLFPFKYKLEFDGMNGITASDVEASIEGGFEDVRDRELCMFIASDGKRLYY